MQETNYTPAAVGAYLGAGASAALGREFLAVAHELAGRSDPLGTLIQLRAGLDLTPAGAI